MVSQTETICNALEIIEKSGWVQNAEHTASGYCLTAACNEAVRRLHLPPKEAEFLKEIVTLQVTAALPAEWQSQGPVAFNDAKGRKKYEIQTVLKTAGACNHNSH